MIFHCLVLHFVQWPVVRGLSDSNVTGAGGGCCTFGGSVPRAERSTH